MSQLQSKASEKLLNKAPLSIVYNKTGPNTIIKPLAHMVKSSSPEPKKPAKVNKKPLIVYGSINQPLLQSNPDILEKLDEYQFGVWKASSPAP